MKSKDALTCNLGGRSVGVSEAKGASNPSSSSCAPMDFSSQVIETQESLNVTKGPSNHEVGTQDGPKVCEREKNLQTDADKPEEEAMPVLSVMESLEGSFSRPSDTSEVAAAPVREHSNMLEYHLTGAEPSSVQMLGDEFVDNIPHTTTIISDSVDFHLNHLNAGSENVAELSGLESFDGVLSEPTAVTGQTVAKFQPKRGAKTKSAKSNSSNTVMVLRTLNHWRITIFASQPILLQVWPMNGPTLWRGLPLKLNCPEANDVLETIDTTLDGDNYISGDEKLSPISEETGNEVQSWNDEEPTSKASEEHGAFKSSRKLRKRVAAGNPSGKLDDGIRKNRDDENSNYPLMGEDCDDDEYRGEDTPKQRKQPKRPKKQATDAPNPAKRRRKTSKETDSTKSKPPKKRFPHGTRRRRQVDKALQGTPEFEIDRRQIPLSELIRLGEANERIASKEAEALKNNQRLFVCSECSLK